NDGGEDAAPGPGGSAFGTQGGAVWDQEQGPRRKPAISRSRLALPVPARALPHFATAKIKTSSRINQARLKDRRPHGPHPPRARIGRQSAPAIARSYWTQKQFVRVRLTRENDNGTDHWISVWTRGLCRIPRNGPLRHRLRFRRGGAQDYRQRPGCTGRAVADHQHPADVVVRRSAQCDGAQAVQALVDAIRASLDRAQHIRAVGQFGADPAVRAVAS